MGPEGGAPSPPTADEQMPAQRQPEQTMPEQISVLSQKEIALETTERMIIDKAQQIDSTKMMSSYQNNLYAIDVFARGFDEKDYDNHPDGIPLNGGDGFAVQTTNGETETVTAITGEQEGTDDAGNPRKEYQCTILVDDPDNPKQQIAKTVLVSADNLIGGHLKHNIDSIAENFTADEKQLVYWYATKRDNEPSAPVMDTVKRELRNQTNNFLELNIARLKQEIEGLTDAQEKAAKQAILAGIEFGHAANGDDLGAMAKMGALERLANDTGLTIDDRQSLAVEMNLLEPQADEAKDDLRQRLTAAGFEQGEMDQILESNLQALIENDAWMERFNKIEGIDTALMGREMSDDEVDNLAQEHLTPEQQTKVKKYRKGVLIAILIALGAAPAALILGGAGAAAAGLNLAAGARQ